MSGVLVRLVVFFSVIMMVVFSWFVLLVGFPVWLIILLIAVFGLVVGLGANALLGVLLPWHVRSCVRVEARRAELYQGW